MSFAEIEKQYVREKAYAEFDWVQYDTPSPVNFLSKSVSEARVALVSTAGIHHRHDSRFNLRAAVGDPSFREIRNETNMDDLVLSHVGYDTKRVAEDKNAVFPLDRLRELKAEGIVGDLAPRHFSFMGYVAVTEPLIGETAPQVAAFLKADQVDLVLLAPA